MTEALTAMRIGPRDFSWGAQTYVMGICNVTPDSFSGDGLVIGGDAAAAVARAVEQARTMAVEGADLIDIGGESTRPGHVPVSAVEEIARVVPAITAIRAADPYLPISIDTTKPEVAEAAIAAGAHLLNDVWGVRDDGAMARVAAAHRLPIVLMHNRAEARYDDVVAEVIADLRAAVERAVRAGVDRSSIIVDPGIGFGKTVDHNVTVLRRLADLRVLGLPILLGTSRKSTLGRILGLPVEERLEATLATTALGAAAGVDVVRVHDVRPNVRAARVADAIVRGHWRAEPSGGGQR